MKEEKKKVKRSKVEREWKVGWNEDWKHGVEDKEGKSSTVGKEKVK